MKLDLRRSALFDALTDKDLAVLEHVFVVRTWRDGHVFVAEGDRADAPSAKLYVLLEGRVGVSARAPKDGFGIQRTLEPGQVFGAVALVAEVPRTATCRAVGPVTTAELDRISFLELFRKDVGVHARFQLVIARSLAADLRALRQALNDAVTRGDDAATRRYLGG